MYDFGFQGEPYQILKMILGASANIAFAISQINAIP
jgi:hypothetical protein